MAHYLLSVWHDEDYEVDFSGDEAQRLVAQVGAFNDELGLHDALVYGGGLQPPSEARVLRFDDGDVTATDGPYAGGKQQMGGFWVIEAADDAAAEGWARKAAAACEGPVELRAFQRG